MSFKLALDYIDVAERISGFRERYPEGSLQQLSIDFREVAGGWWVIYTAAAYRTPEDTRPGVGTAWEPIPGKTPYTKDSEVQNAETAAWGRAIVAVLAGDTRRGIASAEEVRNRRQEQTEQQAITADQSRRLFTLLADADLNDREHALGYINEAIHPASVESTKRLTSAQADAVIDRLKSFIAQIEPQGAK